MKSHSDIPFIELAIQDGVIDFQRLHQFNERLISEAFSKYQQLNRNKDELLNTPIDPRLIGKDKESAVQMKKEYLTHIENQLKTLMKELSYYMAALPERLFQTCNSRKSISELLKIAKICEKNGDDVLGIAIRGAFSQLENSKHTSKRIIKFLAKSTLYNELKRDYFDHLPQMDKYKDFRFNKQNEIQPILVAPLLNHYDNRVGNINEKLPVYRLLRQHHDSLPIRDWKSMYDTYNQLKQDKADNQVQLLAIRDFLEPKNKSYLTNDVLEILQVFSRSKDETEKQMKEKFETAVKYLTDKANNTLDEPYLKLFPLSINTNFSNNSKQNLFASVSTRNSQDIAKFQSELSDKYAQESQPGSAKKREPTHETEHMGPPIKINLLTPDGMNKLYRKLIDNLDGQIADKYVKSKLIKEFSRSIDVLAKGRNVHKAYQSPQPADGMSTASQTFGLLRVQEMEHRLLQQEIVHAKRVQAAINDLKQKNIRPDQFDQMAASFNYQINRMASVAVLFGDNKLADEFKSLLLPVSSQKQALNKQAFEIKAPAQTRGDDQNLPKKNKEEMYASPAQALKLTTEEKRKFLTKKRFGLFNKPKPGDTDAAANQSAENNNNIKPKK